MDARYAHRAAGAVEPVLPAIAGRNEILTKIAVVSRRYRSKGRSPLAGDEDCFLPWLTAFLKFGSLSGLGWLLDFAILLALVGGLGAPTFAANLVSSSVAAMAVFLISRRLIFTPASGGLEKRVAIYFAYTLAMIGLAAGAMTVIVDILSAVAVRQDIHASAVVVTGMAKILVTPPLLILNFLMSRHTSEREIQAWTWS